MYFLNFINFLLIVFNKYILRLIQQEKHHAERVAEQLERSSREFYDDQGISTRSSPRASPQLDNMRQHKYNTVSLHLFVFLIHFLYVLNVLQEFF